MKWSSSSPGYYQQGQALPLCLAVLLLGVISALLVGNTAQIAADKSRLINAADAAAYSGLVWQARALNFQAYANRAMIANQVAMAQAVSLQAWILYSQVTVDNLQLTGAANATQLPAGVAPPPGSQPGSLPGSLVNTVVETLADTAADAPVPESTPLAGLISPPSAAEQQTLQQTRQSLGSLARSLLATASAMNNALSRLQQEIHSAGMTETASIVRQVVAANDPQFRVATAITNTALHENTRQWDSLTARFDSTDRDEMELRADIVRRSVDGFSRERQQDFPAGDSAGSTLSKQSLYRRSATRLQASGGDDGLTHFQWRAKDLLSLNHSTGNLGSGESEVPVGWGQAMTTATESVAPIPRDCATDSSRGDDNESRCTPWFEQTVLAEVYADRGQVSLAGSASRSLLPVDSDFRSFRDLVPQSEFGSVSGLQLHVEVELDKTHVQTSENRGIDGLFAMNGRFASSGLAALSSAEVFFEHPQSPEFAEAANLYHPYWDVRLISTPDALRRRSWALRHGATIATQSKQTDQGQTELKRGQMWSSPGAAAVRGTKTLPRYSRQGIQSW